MTKTATELMNKLAEEDQYGSTHAIGGFEARLDFRGDIELKFVVTEWDGSDYTNGIEDDASS
jgi:hypothetical protein